MTRHGGLGRWSKWGGAELGLMVFLGVAALALAEDSESNDGGGKTKNAFVKLPQVMTFSSTSKAG